MWIASQDGKTYINTFKASAIQIEERNTEGGVFSALTIESNSGHHVLGLYPDEETAKAVVEDVFVALDNKQTVMSLPVQYVANRAPRRKSKQKNRFAS